MMMLILGVVLAHRLAVIVRRVAARLQPLVTRGLVRRHTALRVPLQAARHEIGERRIVATQRLGQRARAGLALAPFGVGHAARTAARVEEEALARGCGD